MKISKTVLLLGASAFMCACSNDDVLAPDSIAGAFEPSEVDIQLGGANVSIISRAPIFDDGSGTIKNLAVWCLAKDAMQENLAPQDIKWFGGLPENNTCCIMNNVKSNIIANTVKWDDVNARYFYPVSQFYRYEFYANYPYTTDISYTPTSVAANYTIDGTQDLIWGRATSDAPYAWSAKYFRANGGQTEENRPGLKLEHLLTRLVFHIQPGAKVDIPDASEEELDFTSASLMMVDSLQICNAYTKLTINVADYNNLDMGIGNRVVRTNSTTDTLYLKDSNGAIVNPIQVPALPSLKTQWGESIMLFPSDQYIVRIVLHDTVGRKYVSEIPLTLTNQPAGFERGKSYNITITVHGATEVALGAQLSPWEFVEGPGLNL